MLLELWTTTSPPGVGVGDVSQTCRAVVGAVGTRRSTTKGEPALSTFPFPCPHPAKMKWTTCVVVALALAVVAMLASTAHAYPSNATEIIRDYGYVRPPLHLSTTFIFSFFFAIFYQQKRLQPHHISFFFHSLLLI